MYNQSSKSASLVFKPASLSLFIPWGQFYPLLQVAYWPCLYLAVWHVSCRTRRRKGKEELCAELCIEKLEGLWADFFLNNGFLSVYFTKSVALLCLFHTSSIALLSFPSHSLVGVGIQIFFVAPLCLWVTVFATHFSS